jgi:hypothetical protein
MAYNGKPTVGIGAQTNSEAIVGHIDSPKGIDNSTIKREMTRYNTTWGVIAHFPSSSNVAEPVIRGSSARTVALEQARNTINSSIILRQNDDERGVVIVVAADRSGRGTRGRL